MFTHRSLLWGSLSRGFVQAGHLFVCCTQKSPVLAFKDIKPIWTITKGCKAADWRRICSNPGDNRLISWNDAFTHIKKKSERLQKCLSFVCIYVTKCWVFGTKERQKRCLAKVKPGISGLRAHRSSPQTRKTGNRCAPSVAGTAHHAATPLRQHSTPISKPSSPAQRTTRQALFTRTAHHAAPLTIYMYKDGPSLAGSRLAIARLFVCHLRLFC